MNYEQEIQQICIKYRSAGISRDFNPYFEEMLALAKKMIEEMKKQDDLLIQYDCWYGGVLNKGWIPCSERLPDDQTNCLVSCDGYIDIATYKSSTNDWKPSRNVIAWMPLLEPYKGDV